MFEIVFSLMLEISRSACSWSSMVMLAMLSFEIIVTRFVLPGSVKTCENLRLKERMAVFEGERTSRTDGRCIMSLTFVAVPDLERVPEKSIKTMFMSLEMDTEASDVARVI